MQCEQLVPIDRGLVMVRHLSGNPRENVAFRPARGHKRPAADNGALRGVWLQWNSGTQSPPDLTLHRLVSRKTHYSVALQCSYSQNTSLQIILKGPTIVQNL